MISCWISWLLSLDNQGYSLILTAVDILSKFLVTIPIANKHTVSVATALMKFFRKYGVCDTSISDPGTDSTSKCVAQMLVRNSYQLSVIIVLGRVNVCIYRKENI